MITKDKESSIIGLFFVGLILILTINVVINFAILDLAYLLFIVGCFIRYIYIKTH